MTHKKPSELITAEDMEAAVEKIGYRIKPFDIVLIRTDATRYFEQPDFLLRQPGMTAPIIGATKLAHLDAAIAALDITLDDAECRLLEEPYVPHPVLGHQ